MLKRFPGITSLAILLLLLPAWPGWGATLTLNVSAAVLSRNNCRFVTTAGTLAFGNLVAGLATPPDVQTTASLTMRCQGADPVATFLISDDDGLYESAPDLSRMQNLALPGMYLPYSISYSPTTATVPKGVVQTLTVTATVFGSDYVTAVPGNYSDTVVLSITP